MNIYDTAHKLAEEIKRSDECVQLAELRERARDTAVWDRAA